MHNKKAPKPYKTIFPVIPLENATLEKRQNEKQHCHATTTIIRHNAKMKQTCKYKLTEGCTDDYYTLKEKLKFIKERILQ